MDGGAVTLDPQIRDSLSLPLVCAPMSTVTGPELVAAACASGVMGVLPRHNASSLEEFTAWLKAIRRTNTTAAAADPGQKVGPLAVNFARRTESSVLRQELEVCAEFGVRVIVNSMGDPREVVNIVHDWGGLVYHDVTTVAHAEKAVERGVDGLTCIVSGGGGHSGTVSPLVFIPAVRRMFEGTILLAGGISTGEGIRAAEILGADLAYLGTRFIATDEARVDQAYHRQLVESRASDVLYTAAVSAIPANWLRRSLEAVGLNPDALPVPAGRGDYSHLPTGIRPWRDIWSAGQGVELIDEIVGVTELVGRLQQQYHDACRIDPFAGAHVEAGAHTRSEEAARAGTGARS
ncbi:MAG: Nitronate monooxygenase [Subtercola sp.]|nr:Nitronate monooxygenase [Subtercola sp.]